MSTAPTKLIKISSLLLLLVAAHGLFVTPAKAQSATALGISAIPPRVEIIAQPGKTVTQEIKVRNESKVERILTTSVKDFIVTDDKGTPVQIEESDKNSGNRWAASNWVQISETKFKLEPGETKSLILTVITPDNALPGGHYAMVLHSPMVEAVINQTGSTIQTNVGSLIYITVPGQINQNARIKEFSAPSFLEYGPVDFKTSIVNLSDIHIAPKGQIQITNWLGGKTENLQLNDTNIFPLTGRDFQNKLDRKFLFGRYKAQLQASYGTAGGILAATLFFWVIPWRLILIAFAAVAIIIALIIISKNKPNKNTEPTIDELEKELEELKNKYRDR